MNGIKPRPEFIPPGAMLEVAKALSFGAEKYPGWNWRTEKGPSRMEHFGAILRHVWGWLLEEKDQETGLSHLAHAGARVLMLLDCELDGHGKDDVPKRTWKSEFGVWGPKGFETKPVGKSIPWAHISATSLGDVTLCGSRAIPGEVLFPANAVGFSNANCATCRGEFNRRFNPKP